MNRSSLPDNSLLQQVDGPRPATPVARRVRRDDPRTVLVVDDQHVVLELVDAFLEDSGYRVYLAGSGLQALDICRRLAGAVDLLVTDVRMPGMSGPELHGRILERHGRMKVLFMSGFLPPEAAVFGVPVGAPLVIKPFQPEELLSAMRVALGEVEEVGETSAAARA